MHPRSLKKKRPGEEVEWTNEDTTKKFKDKNYELYKYEVRRKSDNKLISSHSVSDNDGCTISIIRKGKSKVELGGMNINLFYKLKSASVKVRAVNKKTNQVINENLYTGEVEAGQNFKRELSKSLKINGISYKNTGDYSYKYTRKSGANGKGSGLVANSTKEEYFVLEFLIPSDLDAATTITVDVYYDIISNGDIPVTVLAINSSGTQLKTLSTSMVKSEGTFQYTAPESVSEGSKTYQFKGSWDWQYKKPSTSSPIVKAGSGNPIKFKAPEADKVSDGITVRVYYDSGPTTEEIRLRVIMVSGSGRTIAQISEEKVSRNQPINKMIQASRSVNGVTYNYSNKWEVVYDTSAGSKTISGTGNKASFDIPTATTMGSTVVLKIFYDAVQEVEVPAASEPISVSLDSPTPYGVINGDRYNGSYFTSSEGISTTESQYVYVKTKDYLLGYTLVNRTGKMVFSVPVTMNYTLQYMSDTPDSAGGPKPVTKVVPHRQTVKVEKAYSYWEITQLDYYYVSRANVYNYSLPGGGVSLSANQAYLNIPSLDTWHSSSVEDHVFPPPEAINGIELNAATPITSDTSDRPNIEFEDLTSYALNMVGEAQVKNDSIIFDGKVVLSDVPTDKIAPSPNTAFLKQSNTITHDKVLFQEGLIIDALKENGSYSSNGNVSYVRHPESINASAYERSYPVDVNRVIIHTPVICDPIITADNAKWSQVIHPAE